MPTFCWQKILENFGLVSSELKSEENAKLAGFRLRSSIGPHEMCANIRSGWQ
jgi:hypothetical protein